MALSDKLNVKIEALDDRHINGAIKLAATPKMGRKLLFSKSERCAGIVISVSIVGAWVLDKLVNGGLF